MTSAPGAGSTPPPRPEPPGTATAETPSLPRGWIDSLAAGFLAGGLGGCLFLVVGLAMRWSDFLAYWPTRGYTNWLLVSSLGRYSLLFGGLGFVLGMLLHWPLGRFRRGMFAWVLGIMAAITVLAYLTAWWQIDVLAGLTFDAPARRAGAWLHLGLAGLAGFMVAGSTSGLGRLLDRRLPDRQLLDRRTLDRRGQERLKRWRQLAIGGLITSTVLIVSSHLGLANSIPQGPTADQQGAAEQPGRVVVVGLDGMTFRVLSPLLRAGEVPTFQRFVQEGAWGSFLTYGTASSPRVWTTMATGKRVRDHGINDFVQASGDGYRAAPMRSFDRKARAVWNILSDFGRKVGLVDWLITFPPEEVNGYIVSHLKLDAEDRTFPPELDAELPLEGSRPKGVRDGLMWDIDRAFITGEYLLGKASKTDQPLDFLAVFDNSIDRVEHRYWKYYEPEKFTNPRWQINPSEADKLATLVPDIYRALDRRLGQLMRTLPNDTLVLVVSDHGQLAARHPRVRLQLDKILAALDYTQLKLNTDDGDQDEGGYQVVYRNSQAYTLVETPWTPVLRVNLNLQGRERRGLVPREDAIAVADRLVEELEAIRFDNGRPLFSRVHRTRHPARSQGQGSDIEVALSRAARQLDASRRIHLGDQVLPLADFQKINPAISGDHDHQGIFLALGPGIRRGPLGPKVAPTALQDLLWHLTDKVDAIDTLLPLLRSFGLIERASTLDLTPTVLHTLGLPTARDMAGRPLRELFLDPPALEWVDSYETLDPRQGTDGEQTFDEEYLERLRSLGYVN